MQPPHIADALWVQPELAGVRGPSGSQLCPPCLSSLCKAVALVFTSEPLRALDTGGGWFAGTTPRTGPGPSLHLGSARASGGPLPMSSRWPHGLPMTTAALASTKTHLLSPSFRGSGISGRVRCFEVLPRLWSRRGRAWGGLSPPKPVWCCLVGPFGSH